MKKNDKGKLSKIKNQRGAITSFTLISMMFFVIVLLGLYVSTNLKIQKQEREINEIQKSYEEKEQEINDIYEQVYEENFNGQTPTIEVYAKDTLKATIKGEKKNTIKTVYADAEDVKLKLLGNTGNYVYSMTKNGEKKETTGDEISIKISEIGTTVFVWLKDENENVGKYYTAVTVKLTKLEDKTIYLAEGNYTQITDMKGINVGDIKYSDVQDKTIISLNGDTITGLKAGTTTLTATESNGGATATVTIKVTNVILKQVTGVTNIGENKQVNISGTNYGILTVKSADEAIAKASISGTILTIEPVRTGDTTITVTEGNAGATTTYQIKVVKITLTPDGGKYTMPTSGNATIKSTVNVDNIGNEDKLEIAWTSNNLKWETINNNTEVSKNDCTDGIYYLYVKINSDYTYQSQIFAVGKNTLTENMITITPSTTDWTNEDIICTIKYGSTLTQNRKAGYGTTLANAQTALTQTTTVTATENGYVFATAQDTAGNVVTATLQISNIDKVAPKVELSPNGGRYNMPTSGNATIKTILTAEDVGGSGLNTLQ